MSEWINVGIEYPELWKNVLLTDGSKIAFGYMAIDKKIKYWKCHQDIEKQITHWMPLPEPPK